MGAEACWQELDESIGGLMVHGARYYVLELCCFSNGAMLSKVMRHSMMG